MATKSIKVSFDSALGTVGSDTQVPSLDGTFYTMPGSTGDFNVEKSASDYALFGSAFNASECGVGTWSLSTNAYYSGFCSYLAKIKKVVGGAGASQTGLAMSGVSGLTGVYRAAKANTPWASDSAVVIYDNASAVSLSDIEWIDYVNGQVKFVSGYTVTGPVTANAYTLTLADFAFANDWSLSQSANSVDVSSIARAQVNGGFRDYRAGLKSASLDLNGFWVDGTHTTAFSHLTGSDVLYVEITPSGDETDESYVRGTFKIMSDSLSGDVGSDETEGLSLSLYIPQSVDGYPVMPLSWVHPANSTLNAAVQGLLTEWQYGGDPTAPMQVQYLPDGSNGHGGAVIVTDISVSGGLEALTEFSVSFQGTGAIVDI